MKLNITIFHLKMIIFTAVKNRRILTCYRKELNIPVQMKTNIKGGLDVCVCVDGGGGGQLTSGQESFWANILVVSK